jgi:hypothetical protein
MKRSALTAPLAALLLPACQSVLPPAAPSITQAAAPPTASIARLYQQPAERSLIEGIRLYEEASFDRAETALRQALRDGLADRRDRAVAYKYLAFICCAFNRISECEASFAGAFAADPEFRLAEKEVGHPIWGPVYRRVAASRSM